MLDYKDEICRIIDAEGQDMGRYDLVARRHVDGLDRFYDHLSKKTKAAIAMYFNGPFELVSALAWRTFHIPKEISKQEEIGSAYHWHNDRHRRDTLKVFVYLTDLSEEDGPFHFLPPQETARIVRRSVFSNRQKRGIREYPRQIRTLGTAGTCFMCNTVVCLHRAGIPAPGRTRDVIQFQLQASQ